MGKEEDLNQSRGCGGRASVRGAGPGCKQISAQRARPRWLENCIPSCPLQTREAWAVQVLCLLFHASLFTGLGPVLGTAALGVSQRTLQDPVPARLPALAGLTVALGARYRVPATTPEGSASVLLPSPPLPSSLSPSLSLTLLLTVPGTHQLRSGHRAFARAVLAPRIPLPPASHCECPLPGVASSSERSSLVSSRRTAPRPGPVRTRRHPPPCLIPAPHSSQHPWTYHRFYSFAYYLLPLREGQGEAFCLFGSQTVSRVPST